METERLDKLNEAVQLCTVHSQRISFAWEKIKIHFPLDKEKYLRLRPEDLSFFDQLIFRFSKMQDSMGGKLYRLANKMPHIFTSFNLLLYWSIGINHCKFKICYAAF